MELVIGMLVERGSAARRGRCCLCAKILPGTIKEADGNTMCNTESMWLSIHCSGKELTEGFNRARPAVQRESVILNWWKRKLLKIIN